MLEKYEIKIESQRSEMADITKELVDVYHLYSQSLEKQAQCALTQQKLKLAVDHHKSVNYRMQQIPDSIIDLCEELKKDHTTERQFRDLSAQQQERIHLLLDKIDHLKTVESHPSLYMPPEAPKIFKRQGGGS